MEPGMLRYSSWTYLRLPLTEFLYGFVAKLNRRDPEKDSALLTELSDTFTELVRASTDPEGENESASGNIIWALNPTNTKWAATGIPNRDVEKWEALKFQPTVASSWYKLGVSPGFARLFSENDVTTTAFEAWQNFYGPDTSKSYGVSDETLAEIFAFLEDGTVTPPQSRNWLLKGIPLRDIPSWRSFGMTPTTAKEALNRGVTLSTFAGRQLAVPGTAFPHVTQKAKEHNWKFIDVVEYVGGHRATFVNGQDNLKVKFSKTGRLSTFWLQGPLAHELNKGFYTSNYFHGRGSKLLEKILEKNTDS